MSCWAQRLLDEADREPWQAEITRAGCPFIWDIHITKGLTGFTEEPFAVGTRKRAEAVAHRRIRRLQRGDQRRADRTTITGGTT